MSRKYPVPAKHFLTTVSVNVDNKNLSDAQFREFIRNSLQVVDFPRPPDTRAMSVLKPAKVDVPTPPVGS